MTKPTIYYGACGEGLGHVIRAMAVREMLREFAEVRIFTSGDGFEYAIQNSLPPEEPDPIPGFFFSYRGGKVNWRTTIWNNRKAFVRVKQRAREIAQDMEDLGVTYAISDMDPVVARAAKIADIPLVSLDNQHRFAYGKPDKRLPLRLRLAHRAMGAYVRRLVPDPDQILISSFDNDLTEGNTDDERVTFVRPLIRKEIREQALTLQARPFDMDEKRTLVYLRPAVQERVLNALWETGWGLGQKFVVYGAVWDPDRFKLKADHRFVFKNKDPQEFAEDLRRCGSVIGTAGSNLINECLYMGKPLMTVPEDGHAEQQINGQSNFQLGGWNCPPSMLDAHWVTLFTRFAGVTKPRFELDNNAFTKFALKKLLRWWE